MRAFELQSFAVKNRLDELCKYDLFHGSNHTELINSLKDAITTLNAAALTKEKLSITEDLIRVAQEFVMDTPSMDLTEIVQYQNDFRKILDKLNHK